MKHIAKVIFSKKIILQAQVEGDNSVVILRIAFVVAGEKSCAVAEERCPEKFIVAAGEDFWSSSQWQAVDIDGWLTDGWNCGLAVGYSNRY